MRAARLLVAGLGLLWGIGTAQAQNVRFDVQNFRPTPGPRDLVIVPQSQPLSHLSGSIGAYLSFAFDPLVLLDQNEQRTLDVVKNRLQLDLMGALGIKDFMELGLVMPVILLQQSGNLESLGSEGSIQSTVLGDLALLAKFTFLRRRSYAKGFGIAMVNRVNFPTGKREAFTSDGTPSWNPTFVFDYRFGMGALISLQTGVYIRFVPLVFQDTVIGPTFTAAAGADPGVMSSTTPARKIARATESMRSRRQPSESARAIAVSIVCW